MSDQRLSLPDTAILLVLMAEAREISNPELKERYGLTLDGAARRRLNDRKLVESWKDGRSYRHVLTDAGWAWCTRQLAADGPPSRSGSVGIALYAVLAGLGRLMDRVELSLAEVFGATSESDPAVSFAAPAVPVRPAPPDRAAAPDQTAAAGRSMLDEAGVEARIRDAYQELAPRPKGWVRLAPLREKLADLDRAQVDAALLRLVGQPGVTVVPESNQKTLTAADRAAAVRIGGQDKHLLAIGV